MQTKDTAENHKFRTPFEVNTDSQYMPERLGISKERCKEIDDHVKVEVIKFATNEDDDDKGVANLIENCCSITKNVNEVAYTCFHIGTLLQKIKCDSCKPLGALINALKGGGLF